MDKNDISIETIKKVMEIYQNQPLETKDILLFVLVCIVIIFQLFNIALGSYLKKKAENYASKEDFKFVLEQQKAIINVAEQIKNEMWKNQKYWEWIKDEMSKLVKLIISLKKTIKALKECFDEQGNSNIENSSCMNNYEQIYSDISEMEVTAILIIDNKIAECLSKIRELLLEIEKNKTSYDRLCEIELNIEGIQVEVINIFKNYFKNGGI